MSCDLKRPAAAVAALMAVCVCCAEEMNYPRTELEAGYGQETLTNNGSNWRVAHLDLSRQIADRYTIYGGLRGTRRFGLEDTDATLGLYYPLDATWTSVLELGVSPSHHVLPKYALFGQLQKALGGGWGANVGLRHSEYERSIVDVLSTSAERYWGQWRGAYTLYVGRPQGASLASAHRFQLTHYYGDRNSIGVAYTTGRELENVAAPLGVLSTDVKDWTLSGRHWFSNAWALTYDLVSHEQGGLYRRQGLRLGVRHSF